MYAFLPLYRVIILYQIMPIQLNYFSVRGKPGSGRRERSLARRSPSTGTIRVGAYEKVSQEKKAFLWQKNDLFAYGLHPLRHINAMLLKNLI